MLSEGEAAQLRGAVEEAIRTVSDGSATLSGWLALDCAEMLVSLARDELRPSLTVEQAQAVDRLTLELREISSCV